ncbi:DNA alkylation repair protein [Desulfopila aestuarii]|uniref:3-methyladenine DNA glycosylase AlkD n=1 Tax=Desulfopila aestuarii DSM 18488 TaxID=1121416 RepID=A0A1M7Y4L9_9BACT|nr:DNA alkylation repair protein [Desulfopila aestuarii]SHO47197.1 3-methyladenine DNA glycosylase AlkD [Desulfopila aestuarii DSM 18488]
MNILEELHRLAEVEYKAFNDKIIPTRQKTLGVRVPALRKLAKKIAKNDALSFIEQDKQNIYEMILLEGMAISYLDQSFIDLLPLTKKFLDKVDNWAQIDSTICDFKNIKKEQEEILPIIRTWLQSDQEFVVRAALVLLLAHYVEEHYLETIFSFSQDVTHTGYYVFMANAWLISVCMAKYPEQTLTFLKDNTLDKKTHNKAIQKSRESYRVSKEYKALLNQLKRK